MNKLLIVCAALLLLPGLVLTSSCSRQVDEQELAKRAEYGHGKRYSVTLFGADWCGPCKAMKPDWEQFKKEFPSVYTNYVDYDSNQYRVKLEKVSSVPTVIVARNGVELRRVVGRQNHSDLMRLIGYRP